MILRAIHDIPAGVTAAGTLDRLLARSPMDVLDLLVSHPAGRPIFWIAAAVACLIGVRHLIEHERFLAMTLVLQLAFVIAVYFITPFDLEWHVRWSWDRVIRQLMPLVALLSIFVTLPVVGFRHASES
jgi:hypothetical protein